MARVEDRIALSLSTPMIRRWREVPRAVLADEPALLAIGQALDRTEVVSGTWWRRAGPMPWARTASGGRWIEGRR